MADVVKLNEIVEKSGLKKTFIASKIGVSYQGYCKKMNGKSDFLASEIAVLKDLLRLSDKEVTAIFLRTK